MLLFCIRHGDPIYTPDSLTPLGKRQAEAIAKRLALYGVDRIFSSSSNRVIESATPTSELLKKDVEILDFCNEIHAWRAFSIEVGGEKLRTKYGKKTNLTPLAESWELSCHPDGQSAIVGGKYDGKTAFTAKDKVAKDVVKCYLNYLSEGIVNVVNIFQPEVICLGGEVSNAGEKILKPIRKKIRDYSYARFGKKQTEVQIAQLGNDAGIIGAALLWKNEK